MLDGLLDTLQLRASSSATDPTKQYTMNADGALDFTCPDDKPFVPSDSIRRSIANRLGIDGSFTYPKEWTKVNYEDRNGSIRLSQTGLGSQNFTFCSDFGECGAPMCGCNRLNNPSCRERFREMVVARSVEALRTGEHEYSPVRFVTLGAGSLLTDFEVLPIIGFHSIKQESIGIGTL